MAFVLIKHIEKNRNFEIISEEAWKTLPDSELFIEVTRGDESRLKLVKDQLEQEPHIELMNESCSPVMQIARVVAVTSSGNTKFSVSPTFTDPYNTDEDENYVPELESPSSDSDYSSKNVQCINRKLGQVKRQIFFNDTESANRPSTSKDVIFQQQQISASEVDRRSPDQMSSIAGTSATFDGGEVRITGKQINVDVFTTLHSDTFSISMVKLHSTESEKFVWNGFISPQKKQPMHKCQAVDPREHVGYLLFPQFDSSNETDHLITLTFEKCIEPGIAYGTLHFIKETKIWTAFLKYRDPFVEESEQDTPVKKSNDKTVRLKQHFCLFCNKLKTCIGRHYKLVHSEEKRVKEIIEAASVPETRVKAKTLMKTLRLEGDRLYNESASVYDRIPVRKHERQIISRSVHCPSCGGLFAARNFCKHERRCTGRKADKKRRVRCLRVEERINKSDSTEDDKIFAKIIEHMTRDNLREIVERDPLAKLLTIYLVKSQPRSHNFNNVRQQLRRTARLFLEVQKRRPEVQQIKDMFTPDMYSTVTASIRHICFFDDADEKKKSQLALSYGPLISSILSRIRIDLLKKNTSRDDPIWLDLQNVRDIHEAEFKVEVTRQALISSKHKRMSKRVQLPSTSDIQKLMTYTRQLGDQRFETLQQKFDLNSWVDLGRSLLCQLLVFNRRRVGEMSRIRVEDFKNRKNVGADYFQSLNRLEIILAEQFSIFTIMAKRSRPVNLLITKTQIRQLELLISQREDAGIPDDNNYLFASPTQADGYLKASYVLKSFASQCGASDPTLLKSTQLRKHVATLSQMFCLNDNEMKQLADFLGHDRNVHENFYRLNESNSQITKLSKFLCAVGDKDVFKYRGKTIEELPFDGFDGNSEVEESSNDNTDILDEDMVAEPSTSGVQRMVTEPSTSGTQEALSPTKQKKKSIPRVYKLRHRANIKPPVKLRTPTKYLTASPAKSPLTTKELLNILALPHRKQTKKSRWSVSERKIMETEFAEYLKDRTLPPLSLCAVVKSRYPVELGQRDIHSIYCWLRNSNNKKSKQ